MYWQYIETTANIIGVGLFHLRLKVKWGALSMLIGKAVAFTVPISKYCRFFLIAALLPISRV
jgi:hypothetical protein